MPWQRGHGCCSAKSPCDVATTPEPSHCGHAIGAVPGRGTRAVARVAGELELHRHGRLRAVQRVLERDAHLDLDVVAALAALRLLLRAAPAVEEAAEDVAEVEIAEVERRAARRTAPGRPFVDPTGRTACASPGRRGRRTPTAPP